MMLFLGVIGKQKLAAFVKLKTDEVPGRRTSHIFQSKEHMAAYHHHLCCHRKPPLSSPYQPSRGTTLFSPAYLQSPSGEGWSPVQSWQEPQQGKLLYQVCQASQAARFQFDLKRKLAKGSRQMYCLQLLSKIPCLTSVSIQRSLL